MKTILGRDKYDWLGAGIVAVIVLSIAMMFSSCEPAQASEQASEIPDYLAVKAVYNEALHDDRSLDAMSHALRNRKSLIGVYGLKVHRQIPPKEYAKTLKIWRRSLWTPDPTKGAQFWLSDYDLKNCRPAMMAWRFKMTETLYQGQTHFYKECI